MLNPLVKDFQSKEDFYETRPHYHDGIDKYLEKDESY